MSRTKFLFHAGSAGLSARIHRPYEATLDVQAPSAIPHAGGNSTGQAKSVKLGDLLRVDTVNSQTTGVFSPASSTYETTSRCVAEKFDIGQGTITADLISSELHSSALKDSEDQPKIGPKGTTIVSLKINGKPIELENLSDRFEELDTMDKLRKRHREDESFRNWIHDITMVGRGEELVEDKLADYFPFCHRKPDKELNETNVTTIVPLFRVLTESGPDFRVVHNVIYIRNFGRLQLGDLIIMPFQRRVTGLHIDLGSPVGGDTTVCSIYVGNGQTDPP